MGWVLSAALPSERAARAAAEARKLPVVPAGDPQPTLGLLQELGPHMQLLLSKM